jgi:hypothetical protein
MKQIYIQLSVISYRLSGLGLGFGIGVGAILVVARNPEGMTGL